METTIFEILDEMAEHLNVEQQKKLQQITKSVSSQVQFLRVRKSTRQLRT